MNQKYNDLLRLARPHQYIKNLFIFLPAFFAFQLTNYSVWYSGIQAFISFSFIASSVYALNDWFDRYNDRKHPQKRNRPIAAGRVSKRSVSIFIIVLLLLGLSIAVAISLQVFALLVLYIFLNVLYTIYLKRVPLIDVSIISFGFVIRLLVGAEATNVLLSHWIIVITFLLALFLALAKRRDDKLIQLKTETRVRKVIDGYNLKFLDSALVITATVIIIAYILWSISPEVIERMKSDKLYLNAFFVLLGILRYLQLTLVFEKSGSPSEILLKDRFIQGVLILWISTFIWILYV